MECKKTFLLDTERVMDFQTAALFFEQAASSLVKEFGRLSTNDVE